ncbi:hypothetical protein [Viridibacterium curvum]|uniref:5-formyltetrahydrofolate cyclo-ligase n=1 Tax=Viridibacterium curvum TaxID=1101404 RepID=A0ABP9QSF8_9RHOO
MNMQRRKALGLGVLGWGILGAPGMVPLTGCFTSEFLSKDQRPTYAEKISSVLVTPDRRQLMVLGEKYHYIFDMPPLLSNVLGSEWQSSVRAMFYHFNVDTGGHISGEVHLSLDDKAADSVVQAALAAGLSDTGTRKGAPPPATAIRGTVTLKGQRFRANGVQAGARQALNKEYSIIVSEPENAASIAVKVVGTPITLAADGLLIVLVAGVAVVLLPVFIASQLGNR